MGRCFQVRAFRFTVLIGYIIYDYFRFQDYIIYVCLNIILSRCFLKYDFMCTVLTSDFF